MILAFVITWALSIAGAFRKVFGMKLLADKSEFSSTMEKVVIYGLLFLMVIGLRIIVMGLPFEEW